MIRNTEIAKEAAGKYLIIRKRVQENRPLQRKQTNKQKEPP